MSALYIHYRTTQTRGILCCSFTSLSNNASTGHITYTMSSFFHFHCNYLPLPVLPFCSYLTISPDNTSFPSSSLPAPADLSLLLRLFCSSPVDIYYFLFSLTISVLVYIAPSSAPLSQPSTSFRIFPVSDYFLADPILSSLFPSCPPLSLLVSLSSLSLSSSGTTFIPPLVAFPKTLRMSCPALQTSFSFSTLSIPLPNGLLKPSISLSRNLVSFMPSLSPVSLLPSPP